MRNVILLTETRVRVTLMSRCDTSQTGVSVSGETTRDREFKGGCQVVLAISNSKLCIITTLGIRFWYWVDGDVDCHPLYEDDAFKSVVSYIWLETSFLSCYPDIMVYKRYACYYVDYSIYKTTRRRSISWHNLTSYQVSVNRFT